MTTRVTNGRHATLPIVTHWPTLASLIAVGALIELCEIRPRGSDLRDAMKTWRSMLRTLPWRGRGARRVEARQSIPTYWRR